MLTGRSRSVLDTIARKQAGGTEAASVRVRNNEICSFCFRQGESPVGQPQFTDRELDVMGVLWQRGSARVSEVQAELEDDLAYTTVLTVLQTLEEKGFVCHEKEGRAYRYYPEVDRKEAGEKAVTYLLNKIFRDSPTMLFSQLVSDRNLTEGDLRELRALLDRRLDNKEGEG